MTLRSDVFTCHLVLQFHRLFPLKPGPQWVGKPHKELTSNSPASSFSCDHRHFQVLLVHTSLSYQLFTASLSYLTQMPQLDNPSICCTNIHPCTSAAHCIDRLCCTRSHFATSTVSAASQKPSQYLQSQFLVHQQPKPHHCDIHGLCCAIFALKVSIESTAWATATSPLHSQSPLHPQSAPLLNKLCTSSLMFDFWF